MYKPNSILKRLVSVAYITMLVPAALAGDSAISTAKKEVVVEQQEKSWSAALATGFDSLYIFRGVNIIPGSPLYWVAPTLSYKLTPNDIISAGVWYAVGLHQTKYQELDTTLNYAHTWGNWTFGLGYIFYYVPVADSVYPLYSHELNASASYVLDFGWISIKPGMLYYFNLGPNLQHQGFGPNCGSYLQNRIDLSIPVIKEKVSINPYAALNLNFCYNANSSGAYFNGVNNFEYGVSIPWTVTEHVTVTTYVASSNQWASLPNTAKSLVWFGGNISFAY